MRQTRTFVARVADRLASFRWRSGGKRYFHLELSSRHRAYVAPMRAALGVTAILLGLSIAWIGIRTVAVFEELRQIEGRLDALRTQDRQLVVEAQAEGVDLSDPVLRQLPAEVGLANQLLAKRNFLWTRFLSGLEETIPPRVSIKNVRLDTGNSIIHLTGAAVTVEDITAFALKLQSHPVFQDPVLGQHHTGGDGLVEFDLKFKYRPAGA